MLSAHAHNLAQYVGKGRQQPTGGMQLESSRSTLQRAGYVLYRALVVVVVGTKIARSRVLGVCACYKHIQSIDIDEKLVYTGFELLKKAY